MPNNIDELQEYINKNENIPFNLFNEFKDRLDMDNLVEFECEFCGETRTAKWNTLKNRKQFPNKNICNKCITDYNKMKSNGYPEELCGKGTKKKPFSFQNFLKYKDIVNAKSKKYVKVHCCNCKKDALIQWHKLIERDTTEEICNNCYNLPAKDKIVLAIKLEDYNNGEREPKEYKLSELAIGDYICTVTEVNDIVNES